jgi:hypothetical protein
VESNLLLLLAIQAAVEPRLVVRVVVVVVRLYVYVRSW